MEQVLSDDLAHAPVFVRFPDGRIIHWTLGAEELYGYTAAESVGRISHELLKTVFPVPLAAIDAAPEADGEWRGRLRHTRKDGQKVWTESHWRLRNRADPASRIVVEQNIDISDRVQLERQRELMAQELGHRLKNNMAVVQAIAHMTFSAADRERLQKFDARLAALAEAHDTLMHARWDYADLRYLVGEVLGAAGVAGRVATRGPSVRLTPSSAVAYALAFHELGTNAVKHGALSTEQGRVQIDWRVDQPGSPHLHLTWRESGGPPVSPPSREGFGTRLIRRAVATELGTPVEIRYAADGLVCEFDGPLQKEPMTGPLAADPA